VDGDIEFPTSIGGWSLPREGSVGGLGGGRRKHRKGEKVARRCRRNGRASEKTTTLSIKLYICFGKVRKKSQRKEVLQNSKGEMNSRQMEV